MDDYRLFFNKTHHAIRARVDPDVFPLGFSRLTGIYYDKIRAIWFGHIK